MNHKYALITGASEGLGKFMAIECAARKYNLVLVSLPGSRLELLAGYIRNQYGVRVVSMELELSEEDNCHQLFAAVKAQGIIISVLINNAGIGGTFSFDEKSSDFYSKIISLNVVGPTVLCRLFLSDLKSHTSSYILNVSSLAGMYCLPKKQVYGATKSYLISFSKSLRLELLSQGVSVSALCPGGMNTNWRIMMANRTTGTWLSRQSIMEPDKVAAIAINQMFKKKTLITPGFWNQLFLLANNLFPSQIKNRLVQYQMSKASQQKPFEISFSQQRLLIPQ